MKGLKLALMFAFKPNQLGYCGLPYSQRDLIELIKKSSWDYSEKRKIKRWLETFYSFYSYLSSIGEVLKKETFDEKVVKAYVFGDEVWEKNVSKKVANLLVDKLSKFAISKQRELIKNLRNLPDDIPLMHNFHVLYFCSLTEKMKITLKNQDMCKVSLAKVENISGNIIEARYNKLTREGDRWQIRESKIIL
jgi:hypothetical protein